MILAVERAGIWLAQLAARRRSQATGVRKKIAVRMTFLKISTVFLVACFLVIACGGASGPGGPSAGETCDAGVKVSGGAEIVLANNNYNFSKTTVMITHDANGQRYIRFLTSACPIGTGQGVPAPTFSATIDAAGVIYYGDKRIGEIENYGSGPVLVELFSGPYSGYVPDVEGGRLVGFK